ncbi:MAG TPA: dihydrofolate reductase family protein [Candidatus Acidoferrales bacterium]|nr:dihydrofolate reductase family protein [Candidatus Acidoferrales bacterium]
MRTRRSTATSRTKAAASTGIDPAGVHEFVTDLLKPVGIHLYGRRVYQTMSYWEAPVESYPPDRAEFARLWQKAAKIVFSRTLTAVTTGNTRLERDFDVAAIRRLKEESQHDIIVGGAELAGAAFENDLVDECHLFINAILVGGGKPAIRAGLRRHLELLATRRFDTGVVHLHYRVGSTLTA